MSQLFGCCRVVFNDALAYCQEQYRAGNKKPKPVQHFNNCQSLIC